MEVHVDLLGEAKYQRQQLQAELQVTWLPASSRNRGCNPAKRPPSRNSGVRREEWE